MKAANRNNSDINPALEQHPAETIAGPRSFVDFSAARVGKVWTEEDHAALLRHLAQVDELCIAIWKQLRTEESSTNGRQETVSIRWRNSVDR